MEKEQIVNKIEEISGNVSNLRDTIRILVKKYNSEEGINTKEIESLIKKITDEKEKLEDISVELEDKIMRLEDGIQFLQNGTADIEYGLDAISEYF